MCLYHLLIFWSILVNTKLCGYKVVLNHYLAGCELATLTNLSFLTCLYDCHQKFTCMSVNYHTRLQICVENLANSDGDNCYVAKKIGFAYVNKDGSWNKVLDKVTTLTNHKVVNVCGPPTPYPNTVIQGNRWTEGGKAVYTCTNKRSSAISTCKQDGSWSSIGNVCNPPSNVSTDPMTTSSFSQGTSSQFSMSISSGIASASSSTFTAPFTESKPLRTSTEPQITRLRTSTEPQITTTEPQFTNTEPQFTSTEPQFTSTGPKFTSTEPQIIITEPQITSTEPHITSTEPQITSTEPQITSTEPQITSTELQFTTPQTQIAASEPQSTPLKLQRTSSEPQTTGSEFTTESLLTMTKPFVSTSALQITTSEPHIVTSEPQLKSSEALTSTVASTVDPSTTLITLALTEPVTSDKSAYTSTSSLQITTEPSISSKVVCLEPSSPDCGELPYGDYQSCSGCGYYATCSPIGISTRHCSLGLVWDDILKVCTWTSSTCVGN